MPSSSAAFDRRSFLRGLGAVAVVTAGGAGALSACGSDDGPTAGSSPAKSVSTLRIALTDPVKSTGTDPRSVGNGLSSMVMNHLYDSLMFLEAGKYGYGLATAVTPNADGTVWTITVRSGIRFHDGRPVTGKDVAYSLALVGSPPSSRASVYADVDVPKITVVNDSTVQVPLRRPRGDFREGVLVTFSPVVPAGTTDFSKGIGSGPYKLAGTDPQGVRLSANDGYWGGKPAIGTLQLTNIASPATRLTAVKSGQADYAVGVSPVGAAAERADQNLTILRSGVTGANALSFAMNQNLKPFDDPRVRRAMRLVADRKALVDTALLGDGTVADDVVGLGFPGYDSSLPARARDVATARELFRAAGVSKVSIQAADIVPGMMAAVTLFGQQLAEAGVKLTVQNVPLDAYYADLPHLTSRPFQAFYYSNRPAALHQASTTAKGAFFNVTGLGVAHWNELARAQAIIDDDQRAAAFDAIQKDVYDNGGDVLWGFQDQIDITRVPLTGVGRRDGLPVFAKAQLA